MRTLANSEDQDESGSTLFAQTKTIIRERNTIEPRHAIMCLREINYVMRYDVVKSDVIISRRA